MGHDEIASWTFFSEQRYTRRILDSGKWVLRRLSRNHGTIDATATAAGDLVATATIDTSQTKDESVVDGVKKAEVRKNEATIQYDGSGIGDKREERHGGDLGVKNVTTEMEEKEDFSEGQGLSNEKTKEDDLFDAFWNKILSMSTTIPHYLVLIPSHSGGTDSGHHQMGRAIHSRAVKGQISAEEKKEEGMHDLKKSASGTIDEILALAYLGPYLASHEGVSHGGVVSTLLDEAMGTLVVVRRQAEEVHAAGESENVSTVTARLEVDFVKPVRVPGVVLMRAWVEEVVGRKIWVRAEISREMKGRGADEGDEAGDVREEVCAKGKALFVKVKGKVGG